MSESETTAYWANRFSAGSEPVRVHLIGVGGSGVSGIAHLLLDMGHRVSGSDKNANSETSRLEEKGMSFSSPHTAEVVRDCELVIRSSAVQSGNAAYDAALELGVPTILRAEALAAVMLQSRSIVVAGTHGKTTTSAMAAHLLREGGKNSSHYVGGKVPLLGTCAARHPEEEWFVAEGDESDGTISMFEPEHAVLLNVEAEHLDHFKGGLKEILKTFTAFCDQTSGIIFFCSDDQQATAICAERENAVSYGFGESALYRAIGLIEKEGSTEYTVLQGSEEIGQFELGVPGRHNVLNSLPVIALAVKLGIGVNSIRSALASFSGAARRFEIVRSGDPVTIVDDYGHHPTEIAATIQTARSQQNGNDRLICLFQPHRYSRTQELRDQFGACFDGVDELWVTDIYAASEAPIKGVSGQTIIDSVKEHGNVPVARFHPELRTLHHEIGRNLQSGDWILTLGAGNIHEAGGKLNRDLDILAELRQVLDEPEAILRLYEPMRKHTTLKVGGPAQFWAQPVSAAALSRLIRHCRDCEIPIRVIGRGSNLLVRDGGVSGVVICPEKGEFSKLEVLDDRTIEAGAGIKYKRLAVAAQSAGIGGFEWMEGIPGAVGGSLRMNAGAMKFETFDRVVSVKMINPEGEIFVKNRQEIEYHYRDVPELSENIVISAVFAGTPGTCPNEIEEKLEASRQKRKQSQPIAASAGCAFKNPRSDLGAGQLVDQLGLKNKSKGKIRVSEVHGNFIVNDGGGSASEVLELIEEIKSIAKEKRGISLETEVQIIGQDDPV